MPELTDINVTIDVEHPAPVIGLGRVAIFTPAAEGVTEPSYKEYSSLEALKVDFVETTDIYKTAKANLDQANAADKIAVLTYVTAQTDAALDNFFDKEWNFALMPVSTEADKLAVANKILNNKFKFLVNQTSDLATLVPFGTNRRVINFYHTNAGENLAAAVLGDVANLIVGSATWKFRKNLVGITPIQVGRVELNDIHTGGANAYVTKAGIPSTSEGLTASGEYIDNVHGEDWIKSNTESALQNILLQNDKVTFDSSGIALVSAALTSVFEQATVNGIIEKNEDKTGKYTLSIPEMADVPTQDRVDRMLNGLNPSYIPDGAIHEMTVYVTAKSE